MTELDTLFEKAARDRDLSNLTAVGRAKMFKTPHYIARYVCSHSPEYIFAWEVQRMDFVELCYRYRHILEKDKEIMNDINMLTKKWFAT